VLQTLIIVFREVLEAALVVCIVLAATRGVARRNLWINLGIVAGGIGAGIVALFAEALAGALEGLGQEVFNAGVLSLAVGMLGWHNVWMARHGRELAMEMNSVGKAVSSGARPLYALMTVVALAILREGSEVVLFLYGVAAGGSKLAAIMTGGLAGLLSGGLAGALLYLGLLRIPQKHLFAVTSWMLLLLAAGMSAQCAFFLTQAGYLAELSPMLWDSSGLLPESSLPGQILHALIGYEDRPTGIQLVFYFSSLAVIGLAMKTIGRAPFVAARTTVA
jgi:high-affinity iron transporter